MILQRRFSYMFGNRVHATEAARVLLDHEAQHNIASLFVDDEQVEPVHTGDVKRVVIQRLRAHYIAVHVEVEFTVDDGEQVEYSPYNFDGENDLPPLTTYLNPDETTNEYHWYPSACGEPYAWGEEV